MEILFQEESQRLIDMDKVVEKAIRITEQNGIIFLDELDKVAGNDSSYGPDVSAKGSQRDLLPIVEGSTVATKYGMIKTDHILFIAAGAFNVSKPSDLLPELQGRFPIRVELDSLTTEDFIRILLEPKNALITQYKALMATEGIELIFEDESVEAIAEMASKVNDNMENIGARRLHTIMEKLVDEISFDAPDLEDKSVTIDKSYVTEKLEDILEDENLSRYIPMISHKERANILIEVLPYIRKFNGATIVIKYGGHAMVDEQLKQEFALDVILLKYVGMIRWWCTGRPADWQFPQRLSIESEFVDGMRVTDRQTMDVVEMVLVGR